MKQFVIPFVIILSFLNPLAAQNKDVLLTPEKDKTYTYKITESNYILNNKNERVIKLNKEKVISILLFNDTTDNQERLLIRVLENKAEKPEEIPYQYRNYKYPEFKDGRITYFEREIYESMLFSMPFLYDFDFNSSEIKLNNRATILLEFRKQLKNNYYEKDRIDRLTEDFNSRVIPAITKQFQSIFKITENEFDGVTVLTEDFDIKTEEKNDIKTLQATSTKQGSGLFSYSYAYNTKIHYLQELTTTRFDTIKHVRIIGEEFSEDFYTEKKIELLPKTSKISNLLTISGTVPPQRNKKVTLVYLRKSFGNELYQKTTFLDENNSFQIETDLKHPQIAFLVFGQTNIATNTVIPIYIEPGDTLNIQAQGQETPWEIEFSGNNSSASKMVSNFFREYELSSLKLNFSSIGMKSLSYDSFLALSNKFDAFVSNYKPEVKEPAWNYICNELKAKLTSDAIYLINSKKWAETSWVFGRNVTDIEKINAELLKEKLDSVQLVKIYNDYGIFSRQFTTDYLAYHIQNVRKISDIGFSGSYNYMVYSDFFYYGDLSQRIEIAKTLLAGPSLYAQIANMLTQEQQRLLNSTSGDYELKMEQINHYLNLVVKLCKDVELISEITNVMNSQTNWENPDFVPGEKFLNPERNPVFFNDFFGEKPTAFLVSSDWSSQRYAWDKLAKANPEINFVLVVEGSNFKEWKDFINRAEPVAHQIFLINNDKNLQDIFIKSRYIAYDKNGKFLGSESSAKDIVKLIKESLEPKKKEIDKSQLIVIIWILGSLIFLSIIAFTIWKWRVRQRFREEERKRRLRELELTAIRSQMNPHFLFNSLNSVQNLVQQNMGREAHLYLSDFAGLIRKVLQNSEKEEVSLAEELEMTKQYLNLEKLRFDFDFSIWVEDGIDINNSMVPSMLLQPFTENAVIHGLQNKPGNRKLRIEVGKDSHLSSVIGKEKSSGIIISIEDNGIGRKAAAALSVNKNGKGSKLIKERLEILKQKQGENYSLQTIDLEEGTRVEIFIPEEA